MRQATQNTFPTWLDVRIRIRARVVRKWWSLWLFKGVEYYEEFEVLNSLAIIIDGKADYIEKRERGDGASIPKLFRGMLSAQRCLVAAVPHDKNYRHKRMARREADYRFRVTLIEWARVHWVKAWGAWLMLRLFGWSHWR